MKRIHFYFYALFSMFFAMQFFGGSFVDLPESLDPFARNLIKEMETQAQESERWLKEQAELVEQETKKMKSQKLLYEKEGVLTNIETKLSELQEQGKKISEQKKNIQQEWQNIKNIEQQLKEGYITITTAEGKIEDAQKSLNTIEENVKKLQSDIAKTLELPEIPSISLRLGRVTEEAKAEFNTLIAESRMGESFTARMHKFRKLVLFALAMVALAQMQIDAYEPKVQKGPGLLHFFNSLLAQIIKVDAKILGIVEAGTESYKESVEKPRQSWQTSQNKLDTDLDILNENYQRVMNRINEFKEKPINLEFLEHTNPDFAKALNNYLPEKISYQTIKNLPRNVHGDN